MVQPEDHPPSVVPIRVTCPHCGHVLDVVPPRVTAASPDPRSPEAAPASRAGWLGHVMSQAFARRSGPFSAGSAPVQAEQTAPVPRPWGRIVLVVLGITMVGTLLIWLGQPAGSTGAENPTPAAQPTPAANPNSLSTDEAAILDVLTSYQRAESEAAALLSIAPLQPFIDPTGPFAQRRLAQLAERQRRTAPHRSILVRWAIGPITMVGTTATVVTQETWSNQEAGAVAPEQATVRVTYTLRWDAAAGRWLIVESEQMGV